MKAMEIVRTIMKQTGFKTVALTEALGFPKERSNTISQRFSQKNVSVDLLNEMLRVMGYKIVIMPAKDTTPHGAYKVD